MAETEDYRGHRITLDDPAPAEEGIAESRRELRIDDQPVRYGRLPGGEFFLHDYAYDWTGDVVDLAKRFIDHQKRAGEATADPEGEG